MKKTLPMILQWDESFDIGSDTLTGVNDEDYKPPFPLTAKLEQADDQGRPTEVVAGGRQEARRGDAEQQDERIVLLAYKRCGLLPSLPEAARTRPLPEVWQKTTIHLMSGP